MIRPQDIRIHSFGKALRGYDVEEVKAFLTSLANEWEEMQDENRKLKQELDKLRDSLKQYKDTEQMLRLTLSQAEQSTRTVLENAQKDAQLKMQEAEFRATEILSKAQKDKAQIAQEITTLVHRRDEILGQLKVFMSAQLDRLQQYEQQELYLAPEPERPASKPSQKAPSATHEATESSTAAPKPTASFFEALQSGDTPMLDEQLLLDL
jgi:cell division initiation protein